MADIIQKNMTEIWASSGDVQAPDASKIRTGWVVEAVPRQWWNWFENRQDNNIAYMLQKGIPEWNAETEYQTNKSYVQRNNVVYKATAVSINKDPAVAANSGSWIKAFADSTPFLEAIKGIGANNQTIPALTAGGQGTSLPYAATGLAVLNSATPAAARTAIDAQQANVALTALASTTPGINTLPYYTGGASATTTPFTSFGRNMVAQVDAAGGRNTLGLGTAALYNAQTTPYTAGQLMFPGAFGLGGYAIIGSENTINPNLPTCPTGFYDVAPNTIPGFVAPIPNTWTRIFQQSHSNAAGFATQIATGDFANTGIARIFVRKAAGQGWGVWTELMNSTTFPTQATQVDDAGNLAVGGGKLLRTGAFGLGARLDLRDTVWSTGFPIHVQGAGTTTGIASGGQLGVPNLGVNDLGVLTVHAHWTDASGIRGYVRTFTNGDFFYIQPSGPTLDSAWAPWRQIYTSANTTELSNQITANVTANIQPSLNAKQDAALVNVTTGPTDGVDPNDTTLPWILTSHANTPEGANGYYWYIETKWYAGKGTGNRAQTAIVYNGTATDVARTYVRRRYDDKWSVWTRVDNAGVAATATKLAAARTISLYGGAAGALTFDGSGDVSMAVTITNNSHLHDINTIAGLQAQLDIRTPNANQPAFTAAQSTLSAAVAAGQAVFSVTQAQAAGGYAAACTFLRNGYFGLNLGLSTEDNHLRVGGFSMGSVSYPLLHTGNAASLGFGGTTGSLGDRGWTRVGNGMIIQWGPFTADGVVLFPAAFPNACTGIAQMQSSSLSGQVGRIALNGAPSFNGFNVTGINQYPSTLPARWIAVGY